MREPLRFLCLPTPSLKKIERAIEGEYLVQHKRQQCRYGRSTKEIREPGGPRQVCLALAGSSQASRKVVDQDVPIFQGSGQSSVGPPAMLHELMRYRPVVLLPNSCRSMSGWLSIIRVRVVSQNLSSLRHVRTGLAGNTMPEPISPGFNSHLVRHSERASR